MQRQYGLIQECKSVITTPSGGQRLLDKGLHCITGLAWSGRGKVARVDVSTDGGRNWRTARLESPVLSKCLTRFNLEWEWDGSPAILQSRAIEFVIESLDGAPVGQTRATTDPEGRASITMEAARSPGGGDHRECVVEGFGW